METKTKSAAKRKPWMRYRHRIARNVLAATLGTYSKLRYNIRIEKFKEQGDRPYLILMNHQTAFDQFFVGVAFRNPVYYVASEDLFSKGFISKVIRYLVAPIPIKKQTTDVQAVMNCIRLAREGATIAMAPEGNRTYSGQTEYMNPAITPLIRRLKLPVAFFRIEGGYGVHPRWSDVVRKGKMRAYVSSVLEPEECQALSDEALYQRIQQELYVNEAANTGFFYHKKTAEYLERAIYVCPYCGLSVFESKNDIIECQSCHRQVRYLPTKELEGVGFDFPFPYVLQWYEHQCDFVNHLNPEDHIEKPIYQDRADLSQVIVYKRKQLLEKNVAVSLYGNRIVLKGNTTAMDLSFDEVHAVTVLGRNKLNIYIGKELYQLKSNPHFNALKYVNMFYRYKNFKSGNENDTFLGL